MSVDEENALRCVGGYMIRSLTKKIQKLKTDHVDEMLVSLYSFLEDNEQFSEDSNEDIDDDSKEDPNWVKLLDRGGLFHCRAEFIHFLTCCEAILKNEMFQGNELAMKAGFKDKLILKLSSNDEIQYWWSALCAACNISPTCSEEVMNQILNKYVCIRGFAFTARWMEIYKQSKKRNLQRSKSLRNKLQTPKIV